MNAPEVPKIKVELIEDGGTDGPFGAKGLGEGDSDRTPLDLGCLASRSVYVLGRAASECASMLKQQLIDGVAEINGVDPGSLIFQNGRISGAGIDCPCGEAATAIMHKLQREVWAMHRYINESNPGVTGAHFVYAQIDTYAGLVKILDYAAVHDIGKAINRGMCEAQIQGAAQMGIGAALSERMTVSAKTGKPVSSLKDYHVMNAPEIPDIKVALIEDGGTDGPFGAKGLGEASMVPVAPAVIAAVNDALGTSLCSLPLDPDTIVSALRE
jgi:xanthine dehydrogenase molybdenum-binding subunit